MGSKVGEAIQEALSKGYQIEPAAFRLLQDVAESLDAVDLINRAVEVKKGRNDSDNILLKHDLEEVMPKRPEEIEEEALLRRVEGPSVAEIEEEVEILKDPTPILNPVEGGEGFSALFKSRFEKLLRIASERPDAHNIRRIDEVRSAPRGGGVKVAGLVLGRKIRRNQVEVQLEDPTGKLTLVVSDEAKRAGMELLLDQLAIADVEFSKRGAAIARQIHSPDLPDHVPNQSSKHVYAVFLSDLHVGSKTFLAEAFQRLLLWLQGKLSDQGVVARIKYVVLGGDVVDGIGVYPEQESELEEVDIHAQFAKASQFIEQIPTHMKVLVCPGNHDPTRQALPQPAIPRKYAGALYASSNVTMLGNPCWLRLHGVKILVYHGRSLDDVVATTPGLSFTKPAAAMKVLLKARHLAPMFGGRTPIAPEPEDHMVIDEVPDVFHCGHVHTVEAASYRGTLILNSGTFQGQTKYQANMGVVPTPGIVPVVDLANLEVLLRDFTKPYFVGS